MKQNSKIFKILSIDGGGIKGLYAATILNRFERKYGKISEYFDLICGTSTGGIIALGLGLGVSTDNIIEFYKTYGPKIFNSNTKMKNYLFGLRQAFLSSKYTDKALRDALYSVFDSSKINDSKCCLCVPAVNLVTMKGIIFKTSHHSNFTRDGNLLMTDVALATSAAPTYFPISKIQGISDYLADGGLWANNPSLIGAIEAVSYFVGDDKDFETFNLLSISNLSVSEGWTPSRSRNASALTWKDTFLSAVMDTNSESVHNILSIAAKERYFPIDIYHRIGNPKVSAKQQQQLGLDKANKKSIQLIEDLGNAISDYEINNKEIISFFTEKTHEWNFPTN